MLGAAPGAAGLAVVGAREREALARPAKAVALNGPRQALRGRCLAERAVDLGTRRPGSIDPPTRQSSGSRRLDAEAHA